MRRWVIVVLALALMGHKCKGPKAPREEAADAAEQAFFSAESEELAVGKEVAVVVDGEDGAALVVLTRVEGATYARVTLDAARFDFRVHPDGEVVALD
jgi:hypothetical protein